MISTDRIVWDLPTRFIHWALATCVVLNLFILEEGEDLHAWTGYAAVVIVVLRFAWGFLGQVPIRNRIASLVYIGIWSLILGLGITGWMMGLDAYWGEDWIEELHANFSIGLQILIGLHFLGIIIDSVRYRRRTWLAMIRGYK
ncbi:MAG: cytochrome b/b6 domain-containing protein [Bdellovibrionales bacterium]